MRNLQKMLLTALVIGSTSFLTAAPVAPDPVELVGDQFTAMTVVAYAALAVSIGLFGWSIVRKWGRKAS